MKIPITSSVFNLGRPTLQIFFMHIPKTGGTYVFSQFERVNRGDKLFNKIGTKGHLTYKECLDLLGPSANLLTESVTFAVVRNPWDWHVSWYSYVKQDDEGRHSGLEIESDLFKKMSFSDYLRWLDDDDAPRSKQDYMRKQISDWIVDKEGRIAVDFILYQEKLALDLKNLVLKHNLEMRVEDVKLNTSQHSNYKEYYNDDDIEIVARRHARDIEIFRYSFSD